MIHFANGQKLFVLGIKYFKYIYRRLFLQEKDPMRLVIQKLSAPQKVHIRALIFFAYLLARDKFRSPV